MSSQNEDPNVAHLQDWWQRNGKPLLTGGVVALVAVLGWQWWERNQTNQSQAASIVYQELVQAALDPSGKPDTARVTDLSNQLKQEYSGTTYSQYGSLFVAKVAVESGKLDDAANELKAVVDKPADDTVGELARQRLARVLAAQGKAEDGLKLLEGKVAEPYVANREELRGDLLVSLGRVDDARAAYEKAKSELPADAAEGTLQMKLDDLAKGDA
ncbi:MULTISPECIES: tetratricopeptide repeat protein [Pseudomonas]|uniref:Ancillary SecYEG translocon subunit n=1 Tax=Pseudomonas luteola TaxID=47886 RepID=A0ABS0MPV0_PSELU|nr:MULTISPECIES: tetratricopeptide repeat protein [Pseudomonas]MBA1247958.1 tetratricopeptide repeat protein [Pseudomonas zeshuii]MBH3438717.1 tetratricopeptide repeat protein [Pseudomonas luteola]QEU29977.1 tetratricopeptide repeat protein [Pseudomonas luteola]